MLSNNVLCPINVKWKGSAKTNILLEADVHAMNKQ